MAEARTAGLCAKPRSIVEPDYRWTTLPWSALPVLDRPERAAASMNGTGVDPAITGEPPEEQHSAGGAQ
ncbi:MAG: hypothetical protein HHJ10_11770 [Cellulomonas sp.]|uniref:hypothetical protein n=1 Tax=Cellulomonas sp. TaxID=40001 RepID=UPI00181B5787|nr:hypothetical protein [Cellulomonas sp.]NMM31684.1 hypothetical protein [Cellulomonas sp.]